MKVELLNAKADEVKMSVAIFVFEDEEISARLKESTLKKIKEIASFERFKAKESAILKLNIEEYGTVYLCGLGKRESFNLDKLRRASAALIKSIKRVGPKEVAIDAFEKDSDSVRAIVEGAQLGLYSFEEYKTKGENNSPDRILILSNDEKAFNLGILFAKAQLFARDLANQPPNIINPVSLAERALALSRELGLECEVFDEKELEKMGMNALLSVGKGSDTPPRLVHITYRPQNPKDKIAIVGKALTFDSGGLNIKTGDYMRGMKYDKSGACAVLGVVKALPELAPNVEVHAIFAAAENMPSGKAYRPDDIIKTKNGKYIEIDNTDAEGRVTLADALSFACELGISKLIDLATLTGACMVALGEYTAGLFSNDIELSTLLKEASKFTGERLWELPLDDEKLREKIKRCDADVVNSGGRYGGAITAAMFLQEFVKEGVKWAHLDIAGPANMREDWGYYSKGATGFGTRTLLELIRRL
ncbi:MAG: leucyl aminopeptidase [Aquificaceae bacterium]|nr:leucyl aminopeptidase [Aquificaceae bacterium]